MMIRPLAVAVLMLWGVKALADSYPVHLREVTDWKAVYGQVEARDRIPARARLGGTLVALDVAAGDSVTAGQVLGRVVDDKIGYQLGAIDARIGALQAELDNAATDLTRGEALNARGAQSAQQLDRMRTSVDVYRAEIAAEQANRKVVEEQAAEGDVLAPVTGRVLTVPAAKGAYVISGEAVATVAGGGFYLRLSVPERFAKALHTGDAIGMDAASGSATGQIARVYPLIEEGRVSVDVSVSGLDETYVGTRIPVRLPLGQRTALVVPVAAVTLRSGLDFVTLADGSERVVLPGERHDVDGQAMVEVLSGLSGGEEIMVP